jgi:tellurite methyltransferase
MTPEATWAGYYEANEGRAPREQLIEVLDRFPVPGSAVDLGCGAGIDTVAMLDRGWSVFAVDAEPEAIDRLRSRAGDVGALRMELSSMEDVVLPLADLVWASYSLFFCDPGRFPEVWGRIGAAIRPGGRFAGELLGDRDTWAAREDGTAMSRREAESLFAGWAVERFDEEENDGEAFDGPKHWHYFHVVAQQPRPEPPGARCVAAY